MKYTISVALALAVVAAANAQEADSFEKRESVVYPAAAAPCQPQVQQVQAVQPCPQQLQAVQPCQQQIQAVQPCQQQVQAVQPCQQQVQPVLVQAAPPCQQPVVVQEQFTPPPVIYQQPVYQPPVYQQPVYQQPVYQQPMPQPIYQPQPAYYYPPPPPEESNPGCYSQFGNGLATTSGKLLRYVLCPWSLFADSCDEDQGPNYSYPAPYYPQPYYPPPLQYQAPPPQYQQPQGQWYYNVVPVQSQPSTLLQPVASSLVPDYGLPNGYC